MRQDQRPDPPALAEAIRASKLPKRKPTEEDARPATVLPMTAGQRAALRIGEGEIVPLEP